MIHRVDIVFTQIQNEVFYTFTMGGGKLLVLRFKFKWAAAEVPVLSVPPLPPYSHSLCSSPSQIVKGAVMALTLGLGLKQLPLHKLLFGRAGAGSSMYSMLPSLSQSRSSSCKRKVTHGAGGRWGAKQEREVQYMGQVAGAAGRWGKQVPRDADTVGRDVGLQALGVEGQVVRVGRCHGRGG